MTTHEQERENLQFGAIAIKLGFTTLEQINEIVKLQQRMTDPKKLGELMIVKEFMTEEQVAKVFEYQGRRGGHTHISGYQILSKIGQGAMGGIYKARQLSMDRVVAVKILSAKYSESEEYRQRFLREARAVARLNHPNIIQGIDVGDSNGIYYFAMEYIDGPTIGTLLRRGGALDEKRALQIISQISRAMVHAEANELTHRDIKPDNIMLTRDGLAKLCDLGLAKMPTVDPGTTNPGTAMGTPYYISPEQARGEDNVDIRSDIYSLGATLYHMCVGQVPFEGETAAVVISKHLTEDIPLPRERNPLISISVEQLILKMLEKDPQSRQQNAEELLNDVESVLAGGSPEGVKRSASESQRLKHRKRRLRRRR